MNDDVSILRQPAAGERLGVKRSTYFRDVQNGLITPAVKLGARARGWPAYEISAIAHARIAGKTEDQIRELVQQLIVRRSE